MTPTTSMATAQLLLRLLALCCFILSAWQNPPQPNWQRTVSAGLAFLTASFISWPF